MAVLVCLVLAAMAVASVLALRSIIDTQLSNQLASVVTRAKDLIDTRAAPVVSQAQMRAAIPLGAYVAYLGTDDEVIFTTFPPGIDEGDLVSRVRRAGLGKQVTLRGTTPPLRAALVPLSTSRPLAVDVSGRPQTVTTMVMGFDTTRAERLLHRTALLEAGLTIVACVVIVGLLPRTLDRGLSLIRKMSDAARAVAEGDTEQRLPSNAGVVETVALADAVNDALDARQEAEARLRQFVADASHELRTPLTTIQGWADLHREGGLADPHLMSRAMRRIADSAAHLTTLVEDLALLARLDSGRPVEHQPVDLAPLTDAIVDDLRVIDPSRPITAATPGQGDAAVVVLGDEQRLRQIVLNLTGNALQHTPPGTPIEVGVSRAADQVILWVSDAGSGIPREHQARVFDRFYRGSAVRSTGGTGLGLAIVRSLVDAHGGAVRVESGSWGSRFTVALPPLPTL